MHVELAEDLAEVKVDGVTREEHALTDLRVSQPLGDQQRHVPLGVRQALPAFDRPVPAGMTRDRAVRGGLSVWRDRFKRFKTHRMRLSGVGCTPSPWRTRPPAFSGPAR